MYRYLLDLCIYWNIKLFGKDPKKQGSRQTIFIGAVLLATAGLIMPGIGWQLKAVWVLIVGLVYSALDIWIEGNTPNDSEE